MSTQGRSRGRGVPLFAGRRPMPTLGLIAVVPLLVLAACSGTGAPSTENAATSAATDGGGDVEATSAPPADAGGNGSEIGDFCLVTAAEVSAAFEIDVEATSNENGCLYVDADGIPAFGLVVITAADGIPAFDAGTGADSGAEAVSGIGDEAFYVPAGEFFGFLFRKGDVVVNIGPTSFTMLDGDLARLRAATEDLARMAAGRL